MHLHLHVNGGTFVKKFLFRHKTNGNEAIIGQFLDHLLLCSELPASEGVIFTGRNVTNQCLSLGGCL